MIKSVNAIYKLPLCQYDRNQPNTNIFRIGPIPGSPITARSESARRFDNCKEKSLQILDWLINKGIITCFYPPAIAVRGYSNSGRPSVHLSVCPSVTLSCLRDNLSKHG